MDFLPRYELSAEKWFLIIFSTCVCPILWILFSDLSEKRTNRINPKGCSRRGLRIQSRLADQHDQKYSRGFPSGKDDDGNPRWKVKSIMEYPLKSCGETELNRATVRKTGLQYDRQFAFATRVVSGPDNSDGWKFETRRYYHKLALVKAEVWAPDPSSPTYSPGTTDVLSGGVMVVSFPGNRSQGQISRILASIGVLSKPVESFSFPLSPTPKQIQKHNYPIEKLKIWRDAPEALNMSVHVPPELGKFLGIREGRALGLFRVIPGHEREIFRAAPTKEELGWQPICGFADANPLSLQNLASVHAVAAEIPPGTIPQLDVLRFRPNIIITGPPAFDEDTWKRIRIGKSYFRVYTQCTRCQLPNVDPQTGEKHTTEPFKTLKRIRKIVDKDGKEQCALGMDFLPEAEGTLSRTPQR
ncbi:MAG: hypothetical protein M1824_000994 [Vezdaea acicularis]|nr:MAG: hypothetical protein M1824_000994 [Vezdaea acicularis]